MTWRIVLGLVVDEVFRHVRSRWLTASAILLVLGSWASITLGQRDFTEQRAAYDELSQSRMQAEFRTSGRLYGRGPEVAARAIRSPNPGAILVQGEERLLPAAWDFTPAGSEGLAPYAYSARRSDGGSIWDLEALIRAYGGILALVLGAMGVLADRSSGWYRAVRAMPVSTRRLIAARVLGGCVTLALLVVSWWLALHVVIITRGAQVTSGALWMQALPALTYLWLFFGLGSTVAWLLRSGLRTMVIGIVIWLGAAILGPTLVPIVTQIISRVPTQSGMERERRERYADEMRDMEQTVGRLLAQRLPRAIRQPESDRVATREFPQVEPEWQRRLASARVSADRAEQTWRRMQEHERRATALVELMMPGGLLRRLMAELAGTGPSTTIAWEHAVGSRQAELNVRVFDDRPIANVRVPVDAAVYGMAFTRHDALQLGDLPTWDPPANDLSTRLAVVRRPAIGLIVWTALALWAAYAAGIRGMRQ